LVEQIGARRDWINLFKNWFTLYTATYLITFQWLV